MVQKWYQFGHIQSLDQRNSRCTYKNSFAISEAHYE